MPIRDLKEHLPTDGSKGSLNNPIKCKGIQGERDYLNKLIDKDRNVFKYKRLGSTKNATLPHVLDIYELTAYNSGDKHRLVIDMYHDSEDDETPEGFMFMDTYLSKFDYTTPYYFRKIQEQQEDKTGYNKRFESFVFDCACLMALGYAYQQYKNIPFEEDDIDTFVISDIDKTILDQIVHNHAGISQENPLIIQDQSDLERVAAALNYDTLLEDTITHESKTIQVIECWSDSDENFVIIFCEIRN
jgi:hypothetical protein